MSNSDLKKLISGFLILASLTSSVLLTLSVWDWPKDEEKEASPVQITSKDAPSDKIPGLSYRSSNLTRSIADELSREIIEANPQGPRANGGLADFVMPSDLKDLEDYVMKASIDGLGISIDEKRLRVKTDYKPQDIVEYSTSYKKALDNIDLSYIENLSEKDSGGLPAASYIFEKTISEIYLLEVPTPLLRMHKDTLAFLETQKIFFDTSDPVRALIALNDSKDVLKKSYDNLNESLLKVKEELPQLLGGLYLENSSGFLGIPVANAFGGVDVIGGPFQVISTAIDKITEVYQKAVKFLQENQWLRTLLTEHLKDVLIHRLVTQVINWVNGGGEPQFVTNWQSFLGDAFSSAAGAAIEEIAPQLCSPFRASLSSQLRSIYANQSSVLGYYSSSCTLDDVVENIESFYESFNYGGWGGYLALAAPSGNYYGSLFVNMMLVEDRAKQAQEAARTEAASASGYKSQKVCTDKAAPIFVTGMPNVNAFKSRPDFVSADCDSNTDPSRVVCEVTMCNPNNPLAWQVTTPGDVLAGSVSSALIDSPIGRIVNAGDLEALGKAIVNMAINKLMAAGSAGLRSLDYKKLTEKGSSSSFCEGLKGEDKEKCLEDVAGDEDEFGVEDIGMEGLKDEAALVLKNKKEALPLVNDSIDSAILATQALEAALTQCSVPAVTEFASNSLAVLRADLLNLLGLKSKLEEQISGLETFIEEISSKSDKGENESDITYLSRKTRELKNSFGGSSGSAEDLLYAQQMIARIAKSPAYNPDDASTWSELQKASYILTNCALPQ